MCAQDWLTFRHRRGSSSSASSSDVQTLFALVWSVWSAVRTEYRSAKRKHQTPQPPPNLFIFSIIEYMRIYSKRGPAAPTARLADTLIKPSDTKNRPDILRDVDKNEFAPFPGRARTHARIRRIWRRGEHSKSHPVVLPAWRVGAGVGKKNPTKQRRFHVAKFPQLCAKNERGRDCLRAHLLMKRTCATQRTQRRTQQTAQKTRAHTHKNKRTHTNPDKSAITHHRARARIAGFPTGGGWWCLGCPSYTCACTIRKNPRCFASAPARCFCGALRLPCAGSTFVARDARAGAPG